MKVAAKDVTTGNITEVEVESKPIEVKITNQPEIKEKNPTSYDTEDEYDYNPSEQEMKEMTDAQ